MTAPVYIDTDKALAKLVQRLATQTAIAVDTESNPLFAYRERLCLVQISTVRRDYIIDPLAGVDLRLLHGVLANPGVVKVLHDAEFDVLMLKRTHAFEIASLFDTKVAASALGETRLGLASMLADQFGVELDKRFQRSNWGQRPLSEDQLDYAACDTRYLLRIATDLRRRLAEAGAPAVLEVAAECKRLCELVPEPRPFDASDFIRIKGWDGLDPRAQRVLQGLFVMRHEIADERDVPAFKVLTNDMLLRLARARPSSRAAVAAVRGVPEKLSRRYAEKIVRVVRAAERKGPLNRRPRAKVDPGEVLHGAQRDVYDALRAWRKGIAQQRSTDASLVMSRAAMQRLARLDPVPTTVEELAEAGAIEPWRVELYGDALLAALRPRRARAH